MKLFDNSNEGNIPVTVAIVPTIDVVVFPHNVVPLLIIDSKIIAGVQKAIEEGNKQIVVVACKRQSVAPTTSIGPKDLFSIGTLATIVRTASLQDGTTKLLIQGISRVKITAITLSTILEAEIEPFPFAVPSAGWHIDEKIKELKILIEEAATLKENPFQQDFAHLISRMTSPEKIIDFIISHLTLSINDLQKLLETPSYENFFSLIESYIVREKDVVFIQQKIKNRARESMNSTQREFYVREQIKALKEEIGDDTLSEHEQFYEKFHSIEPHLNEEAKKEIQRCLHRLETMSAENSESNVLRNYLECVFDLPWGKETVDNENFIEAKKILDENHYGLQHIKDRILDFLSVKFLSKNNPTTILCFYGPPGVGKTSLSYAIAKALKRNVFRVSVGGMRDEAEIRGHRRTYVGAIPGRFIKGIRQAKSRNPIIIIDEIDKIGQEFKGDPAAALLEILDPHQNHSFYDYYVGFPFDFSKTFFIATANKIEAIPSALRDRLEIIELPAYTFEEKKHIAEKHLLPKIIEESGLKNLSVDFDMSIIDNVVNQYTYEAGVRDLERWLRKLCSRIARRAIENNPVHMITNDNIEQFIGTPRFTQQSISCENKVGVSRGLCWTSCGGDVMNIETVINQGKGNFILTGQLGDVMKESARAALSFIKANGELFGIAPLSYNAIDIHVHVPAGAIQKEGPSAGVTILVSILSALSDKPVKGSIAMTGEIGLQGDILPVGGIKEKILAAQRNGITKVIIPHKNKNDVLEIKESLASVEIIYAEHIKQILPLVFVEQVIEEPIAEELILESDHEEKVVQISQNTVL